MNFSAVCGWVVAESFGILRNGARLNHVRHSIRYWLNCLLNAEWLLDETECVTSLQDWTKTTWDWMDRSERKREIACRSSKQWVFIGKVEGYVCQNSESKRLDWLDSFHLLRRFLIFLIVDWRTYSANMWDVFVFLIGIVRKIFGVYNIYQILSKLRFLNVYCTIVKWSLNRTFRVQAISG